MSKPSVMCQWGTVVNNRLQATLAEDDHRGWEDGWPILSSNILHVSEGLTGPRFTRVETKNTLYIIPSDNFLSKGELVRQVG